MRILYIVHQFFPEFATGTEIVTLNLAKAAQRTGHHVEVLTCALTDRPDWRKLPKTGLLGTVVDGIPVWAIPSAAITDPYAFGGTGNKQARQIVNQFLDEHQFDLVHVTHSFRMLDAVQAVRQRQVPYVVTLTDFFTLCYRINLIRVGDQRCDGPAGGAACKSYCQQPDIDDASLQRRRSTLVDMLRHASEVIACSRFVADVVQAELPELRIRTIGHGIDLLKFLPATRRKAEGKLVFGFLGTKSKVKGVHILAQAFARAKPANACLEIVGPTYSNDELDGELRSLAASCDAIRLKPAVSGDEIAKTLAGFDLLCVPSQVPETFSLSLHEGFAAGLPALVGDLGNPAAVVTDEKCGLVVPHADISAWADAFQRVADRPHLLDEWRSRVPLPRRREEETFLYDHLYRTVAAAQ